MRKVMHNKKRILGIVGAFLFVLFLTYFLPGTATAVQNVDNTYAVVVTTGNDAGTNVSYFGLQYKDTAGYTHLECVFPHKGGLQNSFDMVLNGGGSSGEKALSRGKTNTYFFEPAYEVAEIIGLDIYCQSKQGALNSWDVSGLRIYEVAQIIDVISNGGNNVIRFNGTQLAHLEERNGNDGVTFSWTGNKVFQLRGENTSHRLIFENIPYSMEGSHDYAIRLDFADVNGAGIEQANQSYKASASLREANFGEYMALEIEYLDVYGDTRSVTMPVVTTAVDYMLEHGVSGDTKIAGIAQQGDTIVLGCSLQDMQEVKAIMLYNGQEAANLLTQSVGAGESVSITGVSVYKDSSVSLRMPSIENCASAPDYSFSGAPLFYHTATTVSGETISENGDLYVSMRPYENGAILKPTSQTEKYLIELFSAPSEITGVPEDVTVSLQYVDLTETLRETEAYSVRSGAKEFYGYWPATGEDFAYTGQIAEAAGISFVVELPQVEHFTHLRVSVPEASNDWRMAGFRVTRLNSVSKRYCVWEDIVAKGEVSNRRYYRNTEGYLVFYMDEVALIQPGSDYEMDFVSQSVQQVEDFNWRDFLYSMTYEQVTSNLGLSKARENYTVEVQVQSGTTSLLDGYGDNGSKNRFYFLLEFEDGDSGYVMANQQLSADGFRSGCTESFVISTNYDYGDLVAVHIIPDDISEESDPYDKLNIAQIRVRRNDNGSISKEWIIQNVGWVGIDYRDEGANNSIAGLQGRSEAEISRIYPVTYSSYALNLEFRMGTGTYNASGSGGAFYGTMEGTLEYYNQDGKRNQLTFDVIRAMYDYANKTPIYLNDGTTGSTGTPLAVTDNSFMFRENHTDRFVISVSDVAKLGKLTLNMNSKNGGSLAITNVTASLVLDSGLLEINEQDEYMRQGKTEYLCEDTVDKIPAFDLTLPTGRNIYQEIYFGEHEAIKLDTANSTWISAVSRVPTSKNDTINIFVYPAENASGSYAIDVRAQYTNTNGTILETGAKGLAKETDAEGNTVYSAFGLTASSMSTLDRVYVKAQTAEVVDAYIDHVIIQQVRAGVVINTFYLDCEHRNAATEFFVRPSNIQLANSGEQKVYLALGEGTEAANLISENRDLAVALRYTTVTGGKHEFISKYIYITDQQYQAIKAGDIIELTFNESYLRDVTGVTLASSGNVKAQVDMAMVDNYSIDAKTGTKQLMKHFSFPTGVEVKNQVATLKPSDEVSVEIVDIAFTTALADAYLESGTTDPIIMAIGYVDNQGVQKEAIVKNVRDYAVSDTEPFSTGSTTTIRLLLRDIASAQYLQLMPYDSDPKTTAGWKPSQIVVSIGTDGALQRINRALEDYIVEDTELDLEKEITGEMIGGTKINLANIIVMADVAATNQNGIYGNSYRVTSAGNKTLDLVVLSEALVRLNVSVSNSEHGHVIKAERASDQTDISGLIEETEEGFLILTVPKNETEQDQTYKITISSSENEKIAVEIQLTVKATDTTGDNTDDGGNTDTGGNTTPSGGTENGGNTNPGGGENGEGTTPGGGENGEGTTPGGGENGEGTTPGGGENGEGTNPGGGENGEGTTPGGGENGEGTTPGGENGEGTTPGGENGEGTTPGGENGEGTTPGGGENGEGTTPGGGETGADPNPGGETGGEGDETGGEDTQSA